MNKKWFLDLWGFILSLLVVIIIIPHPSFIGYTISGLFFYALLLIDIHEEFNVLKSNN